MLTIEEKRQICRKYFTIEKSRNTFIGWNNPLINYTLLTKIILYIYSRIQFLTIMLATYRRLNLLDT